MPKIVIEIPVELGTTVYLVHDKCRHGVFVCPFNGGYGTDRCRTKEHGDLCSAYYEEVPFTLGMREAVGKDIFLTEKEAQKEVDKLNRKR